MLEHGFFYQLHFASQFTTITNMDSIVQLNHSDNLNFRHIPGKWGVCKRRQTLPQYILLTLTLQVEKGGR
jgi:hypothetical protein